MDNGTQVPSAKTKHYEPGVRLPLIIRNLYSARKNQVCLELVSWVDVAPTLLDFAGLNPLVMATSGRLKGGGERGPTDFFHGKSWKPYFAPGNGQNTTPFRGDTVFLSHTFHEVTMYYPMRSVVTKHYKLILNVAHDLPFPFAADLWSSATWQGFLKSGKTQYGQRVKTPMCVARYWNSMTWKKTRRNGPIWLAARRTKRCMTGC